MGYEDMASARVSSFQRSLSSRIGTKLCVLGSQRRLLMSGRPSSMVGWIAVRGRDRRAIPSDLGCSPCGYPITATSGPSHKAMCTTCISTSALPRLSNRATRELDSWERYKWRLFVRLSEPRDRRAFCWETSPWSQLPRFLPLNDPEQRSILKHGNAMGPATIVSGSTSHSRPVTSCGPNAEECCMAV
jgi:hypothetical protein